MGRGCSLTDHKHYRLAALAELQRLVDAAPPDQVTRLDYALDQAIRNAKGLPVRPADAAPLVRLFAPPPAPDPAPVAALAALVGDVDAKRWHQPIRDALARFGITDPLEVAHWLAQCLHETAGFRYLAELWGPTPAQQRYEGRADLGNTEPGDGHRYRGRGLIQLTGRANYQRAGEELGLPLVAMPERVADPDVAALTAAWYWHRRGIGEPARRDDLETVTRLVNGGLNGLDHRRRWLARAKAALGIN